MATSDVNQESLDLVELSPDFIKKLTIKKLKTLLKQHNELLSGNKSMLLARCLALKSRLEARTVSENNEVDNISESDEDPFADIHLCPEITYKIISSLAKDKWCDDLRKLVECNFHQLFDYLVTRTQKFESSVMKGSSYKKLKSFNYFLEGHVSKVEISHGQKHIWVRAKVLASMKKQKYSVIVVFTADGDVVYAACECPAGLGVGGCGKCNHIGGLLFAVNSFTAHGLQRNHEKISCTSMINGWIVPRNLNVNPKPIYDIKVSHKKMPETEQLHNENSLYDPRAPNDRGTNMQSLNRLYENLSECAPTSGFFMFHNEPVVFEDEFESLNVSSNIDVQTEAMLENIESCESSKKLEEYESFLIHENPAITDSMAVNEEFIQNYVNDIIENEHIDKKTIDMIESDTKSQSESGLWKQLHGYKMTSSNFGKIVNCKISPQSLLKSMLYDDPSSKYLEYGKAHEQDAISAYEKYKSNRNEMVKVKKVGLILSEERPGFGTSLDGIFEYGDTKAGIECKCPFTKKGLSIQEACKDPNFYLHCDENGNIKLKTDHFYYVQIQGQLFISKLSYVDFIVWFGKDCDIHVETIHFDDKNWRYYYLPKLDFFYKWAFVPELLTRRVQRGIKLHTNWQTLLKNKIK